MTKPTRATETQDQPSTRRASRQTQPAPAAAPSAHLQRLPDNPAAASAADVSQLQSRYGNRAVQSLLSRRVVQAKLEVGPANDSYEQEADRMAQQVMRMPETKEDDEEKG